jgi:hypothetical protein
MRNSTNANFNYPVDQLNQATRDLTSYVLIDKQTGKIWTSDPDERSVHSTLQQAVTQFSPENVG